MSQGAFPFHQTGKNKAPVTSGVQIQLHIPTNGQRCSRLKKKKKKKRKEKSVSSTLPPDPGPQLPRFPRFPSPSGARYHPGLGSACTLPPLPAGLRALAGPRRFPGERPDCSARAPRLPVRVPHPVALTSALGDSRALSSPDP